MARRRSSRRRSSREYEQTPVGYQLGGERRSRAGSYRKIFLESQVNRANNFMSMASQELGNDYNIELHRLTMLQDEMANLDDMISNWHNAETQLVGKEQDQRMEILRFNQKVEVDRANIADRATDNAMTAHQIAVKEIAVPRETAKKISDLSDPKQYAGVFDAQGLLDRVRTQEDFSEIRGLTNDVQRQRAALDLSTALTNRLQSAPGGADITAADRALINQWVQNETGVGEDQLTQAQFARNRNVFINNYVGKNSYAGSTRNMLRAGGAGQQTEAAAEAVNQRSEILQMWIDRRAELAGKLETTPDAPSYEDVRSRAREMYDPTSSAGEARAQYKEMQEARSAEEEARRAIQAAPKDQRILMKAARSAQRGEGDLLSTGATGPNEAEINLSELDSATFIQQSIKDGTLSMDRLIPYATSIAQAENIDGSPEDVVSARDRILSGAMHGLYRNYMDTLPSNDLPSNQANKPPIEEIEEEPAQSSIPIFPSYETG